MIKTHRPQNTGFTLENSKTMLFFVLYDPSLSFGRPEDSMASTPPETIAQLHTAITSCRKCPRLVRWREKIAKNKRASFADWEYWGKPVPGFGDPGARVMVLGLAPAAHGANRTGRVFTGDESGRWLYRALHRAGFANQAEATHIDDGLKLKDAWVSAAVRCAPPENKPTRAESNRCRPFLLHEMELLSNLKIIVCLGSIAMRAIIDTWREVGVEIPRPLPKFGHGATWRPDGDLPTVLCSYHPSQRNTFTGRLTEPMFDQIFQKAHKRAGS